MVPINSLHKRAVISKAIPCYTIPLGFFHDIITLWLSNAIWRHRSGSTLARVSDGTKLLPGPMFTHRRGSLVLSWRHDHRNCPRYNSQKTFLQITYKKYGYITQGLTHLTGLRWQRFDRNHDHIDGSVQDCSNSIANAMELLQSCTNPSICYPTYLQKTSFCFSAQ